MRIQIKDNEAGFVCKKGRFVKMIRAGQYYLPALLGYSVSVEEMSDTLDYQDTPYEILAQDRDFAAATVHVQIPDGMLGLLYINGNLNGCCTTRREYTFWNVFEKVEIRLLSMEQVEITEEVTKKMLAAIPERYYTKVVVGEGEVALLRYNQKLARILKPGVYYFWNYSTEVTYQIVDLKWREMAITGQEILTRDKIGIRLNVVCEYRIVDAEAVLAHKSLENQLYSYIQLIIRELVGNYQLDEILEKKVMLSELMAEKLSSGASAYAVEFARAGIKDIILPGEIRDIMNTVLVAEKQAQANVITRREEVASTRSLLNTAKLMDENATLYQLKKLEYIERICGQVGEISVSGKGDLVEQLGQLIS
ncbi:MAG: slipin family protein [Lachnospiraceae bacterium]|nr:slipin family protein [Lachnospiraceae bacterium]